MRSPSTLGWRLFSTFFFPLVLLALTVALYWRLFLLPFFWDDAPHFLDFTQHSQWQIWSNQTGYGYYRPLVFSFYKIVYHTWQWPPRYFYAVALIFHWLNALLVAQVVSKLQVAGRKLQDTTAPSLPATRSASWFAAILFITYPFSVITLGNVAAATMHPLVTCMALLSTLAMLHYLQNQSAKRWPWLVVGLIATLCAPLLHESGVIVGAIVSWVILVQEGWKAWQRRGLILLFPILNLLYLPLWFFAHQSKDGVGWVGWQSIGASITFFVQGLTYLFQPIAQRLIQRGTPEFATIWWVAIPTLLLAGILLWRRNQRRLLFFALGWFGLSIAPSVIGLPFSYIYPSMRLHYLPGVAAVVLLSMAMVSVAQSFRTDRLQIVATWGLLGVSAAFPLFFVYHTLGLHQFALAPIWQMAEIVRQLPTEKHLLINPIDWMAYRRVWYPLGHEGVEVMPSYIIPAHLASINARLPAHMQGVVFPTLGTTLDDYQYGFNGEEWWTRDWAGLASMALEADRVWLMRYDPLGITIEEAGSIRAGEAVTPATYLANFEDKLFLRRAEAQIEPQIAPQQEIPTVRLTLDWRYLGPDPQATVFRHLLDCAGNLVGQGDGYLLGRALSFAVTPAGAEIRDVRQIPLEFLSADGCYRVEVGLFRADGQRLQVFTPDGSVLENAFVSIPVN